MIDDDIDAPEDFEKQDVEKPSLKEAWENNPMLKLAAVVLGVAILGGGYVVFFSKSGDEAPKARMMNIGNDASAKTTPGLHPLDPADQKALEDLNKKKAIEAAQTGGSALPIPIAPPKGEGLQVPDMPSPPKSDVLAEWKRAREAARSKAARDAVEEENNGANTPPPEVVPMGPAIRPQQMAKQDPNAAKRLSEQMRVIVAAQIPPMPRSLEITKEDSPYVAMKKEEEAKKLLEKDASLANANGVNGVNAATDPGQTIVPAGSIAYAQLLTELNSDIQGPVLAQMLSGPFAGGRIIGKIEVKDEYMVINFTRIVKDTVSYKMNGVALDENTTLAGQATDVDHHYFVRVILPAAAKFIEGYGSSVSQTSTTVSQTAGGGQAAEQSKPDAKQNIYKGVEEGSKKVSEMLDKAAERPITVKIAKGTTMGVFFTETVTTKDAGK